MRLFRLIMIAFVLAIAGAVKAEEHFSLYSPLQLQHSKGGIFEENCTFSFSNEKKPIYGFSISGSITKKSTDYLVRVLLKGVDGRKRLVLESYEAINHELTIAFDNYCEETVQLDSIVPDSIIIIVKDATLQINRFYVEQNIEKLTPYKTRRASQVQHIADRINAYNASHGKLWRAGETTLSILDYEERNALLGISDNSSSGGLEYYIGGIFEIGEMNSARRIISESECPDSLDWRNRHGKNWMTSVKHQFGPTCTVYATVGCVEALTNLYYNRKLDLDLSEYELICCADSFPHDPSSSNCQGFSYYTTLEYARNHGIFDESSYPFVYPDPYVCRSEGVVPTEQVHIGNFHFIYNNSTENIKQMLNEKGPLCFAYNNPGEPNHSMVLVGYNTIKEGDTIRYYNSQQGINIIEIIHSNNPYIGMTYWILKNSWGIDPQLQENSGYMYLMYLDENDFMRNTLELYVQMPVITMNHNESDIIVEDADGDGYYFWGLGSKPSFVPEWIPNIRDCDDADPSTAIWGINGSQTPCSDIDMVEDATLHGTYTECNTIHVNNCTVTDVGNIYFLNDAQVTMHWGGTFVIDGGVVANAHPYHYSGSKMEIKNGGKVYLKKGQDYYVPYGCELEITEGEIRGPYEKKQE